VGFAPFFSPDSQWIGFVSIGGKLNKISVEGGAVVPLGDFGAFIPGSWGEDGNIFLGARGKGLVRVRDGGGAPRPSRRSPTEKLQLLSRRFCPEAKQSFFRLTRH